MTNTVRTILRNAIAATMLLCATTALGAKPMTKELFKPMCDSIAAYFGIYLGQEKLEVSKALTRGNSVDLYFNRTLANFPMEHKDVKAIYSIARATKPYKYDRFSIGKIFTNGTEVSRYTTSPLSFDGRPMHGKNFPGNIKPAKAAPLVTPLERPCRITRGLAGSHLAVWQSHGYYFERELDRWEWQRARILQTVEDLYTQSYVIPYLVPMLENAGAYVLLPRERDINDIEVIVDNDSGGNGRFSADGKVQNVGEGFGYRDRYLEGENPFKCGTAVTVTKEARWTPDIPRSGRYAVYVSYKSMKDSGTDAIYEVCHAAGTTSFRVNQKIGSGTWIYLGTFPFESGQQGYVLLRNNGKGTISADAVKFGGGMGSIARGVQNRKGEYESTPCVSGYPRWCEGARYWLQYAGFDESVYSTNEHISDYKDDFMSRGLWVGALTGGSSLNPNVPGKGIPVDLALGFHSDAGIFRNDSIIGTLAIHTLRSEGSQRYPSGEDRITSRELAASVQGQIVNDIRILWEPQWTRRSLWDRSYYEAHTPPVPAMLLELLSHQNLADMIYGLDPGFRFTVSRAVYKGILKYLSSRYSREYIVQPLPVKGFSALFCGKGRIRLEWEESIDEIEPTAAPEGYIVYTKRDDGHWDKGVRCTGTSMEINIAKGHIYSFKVAAYNDGGISFPSETLSAGIAHSSKGTVLAVNGFDRISAPVAFASKDSTLGGFLNTRDSGVPYICDISFTGEQYEFRRDVPWKDDDNPGFGASFPDYETQVIAGNTFDYPSVHGASIIKAGYSFCSCSRDAYTAKAQEITPGKYIVIDLILGKQRTTPVGLGKLGYRFKCFPMALREALEGYLLAGGNLIVSGAYIGTDIWENGYCATAKDGSDAANAEFACKRLHYRHISNATTRRGEFYGSGIFTGISGSFPTSPCRESYCVESPDAIAPVGDAVTVMRYRSGNVSAATLYTSGGKGGSVAAFGFPLETITHEETLDEIISRTLKAIAYFPEN